MFSPFCLFSTALWGLSNSRPVHSLMMSSHLFLCLHCLLPPFTVVPAGSPSRAGDVVIYVFDINRPELSHSFLFCSCVCFCLYGPFNCISFQKFSRQLSASSLCSSCLISALSVLSTVYLFMKVSCSPSWLTGLKTPIN